MVNSITQWKKIPDTALQVGFDMKWSPVFTWAERAPKGRTAYWCAALRFWRTLLEIEGQQEADGMWVLLSAGGILHHPPRVSPLSVKTVKNLKFLLLSPKRSAVVGWRHRPAPGSGCDGGAALAPQPSLGSRDRPCFSSPSVFQKP